MWPIVFAIAVFVLFVVGLLRTWRRAKSRDDLRLEASAQPVEFRMSVRARVRRGVGISWLRNGFGGVELLVRGGMIVVELAGPMKEAGRGAGAEVILHARQSTMRTHRFTPFGTGLFPREALVISGADPSGPLEVLVVPRGPFDQLWLALQRAGVTTTALPHQ